MGSADSGRVAVASPWLSVLIPAHNVEPWLRECLESILAQADAGVEIVLLDDASSDQSLAIARSLQARARVGMRILSHETTRGVSAARNALLDAARGQYFWFIDADDLLLPGSIAALRGVLQLQAVDLVLCDFRLLRAGRAAAWWRGGRPRAGFAGAPGRASSDRDLLVRGVMQSRQLHPWSKIGSAAVWRQVRFPEGRVFEDIAVIPQLLAVTSRWRYVNRSWIAYRRRQESITAAMTPLKHRDLLAALHDLHVGLSALPGASSDATRRACATFYLRSFVSIARNLPPDEQLERDSCELMRTIFPDGMDRALSEYRRDAGWLRARRERRGLLERGWVS